MLNIKIKSVTSRSNLDEWISCYQSIAPQRILFNPQTQQQIQQHIFINQNIQKDKQMQLYENRLNHNTQLVRISHVNITNNICQVWIEYIPCRLNNLKMINNITALILLKESAKGFQRLLNMGWYLNINDEMIMINYLGFVKVWLSRYLYYNTPRSNQIDQIKIQSSLKFKQGSIIKKIILLIGNHLQPNQKIKFQQAFSCNTFDELFKNIQKYTVVHNINLPQRVNLTELQIQSKDRNFIQVVKEIQFPNISPINKHKPNQSSLNNVSFPKKQKRFSLMNIDSECLSQNSSNLPTPSRNMMNQRFSRNINKFKMTTQKQQNPIINQRHYTDASKQSKQQSSRCLFDSREKEGRISETKRVQSQYNIQKLEFSRLKFKNMRKQIMKSGQQNPQIQYSKISNSPYLNLFNSHESRSADKTQRKLQKTKQNNKSHCQLFGPFKIDNKQPPKQQAYHLNFNQKCKTPRNKSKGKNTSITKFQINQISKEVDKSNYEYEFPQNRSNNFQYDKDDKVLNQIQAQFQQFIKTSQNKKASPSKDKKHKQIPNIQFSKTKQSKRNPSPPPDQTKKFQYSHFYSQEVDIRNSQIRAKTSRQKLQTKLLTSNRSTYSFYQKSHH